MIKLYFALNNPWPKENFKNLFSKNFRLTLHKYLEFEIYRYSNTLLEMNLEFTTKCSHAGLTVHVAVLGINAEVKIYDCRHWCEVTNQWQRKQYD